MLEPLTGTRVGNVLYREKVRIAGQCSRDAPANVFLLKCAPDRNLVPLNPRFSDANCFIVLNLLGQAEIMVIVLDENV